MLSGDDVAVKLENINSEGPRLKHEWNIYRALGNLEGIPQLLWFSCEHQYFAMVTDLLGPSLSALHQACGGKFSLETVLMIADQMVCIYKAVLFLIITNVHV